MLDRLPIPEVELSRVGVFDLLAGDLERQRGLVAWHRRDGDKREADLERLRFAPDTLSLLKGFKDCRRIELDRWMEESILTASLSCCSKAKWDIVNITV